MGEPTVCVKALRPPFLVAGLRTGIPLPELTAKLEVPGPLLTDLAARVPHSLAIRVWEQLAELTEDSTFGLTVAMTLGVPQLDLMDHVLARAPSIRALTRSFERYQRLFHDANDVQFREVGDEAIGVQRFSQPLPRSRHFTEFILAMWVARLRSVGCPPDAVRRITLRHAARSGPYAQVFGVEVQFDGDEDALILNRATLDVPLAANEEMRGFEAHLDAELDRLVGATLADRVRVRVVALLRAGSSDACEIEAVARQLAVSRRTLQRRLGDEGTSFRDVVDSARKEIALAELARGVSTMTDLAFLLGFSENSAFSRAFRRWTGRSPGRPLLVTTET